MTLNPPVVSSIAAGVLLILQTGLMIAAVRARLKSRQPLGDAGQTDLIRAVRRHGNFAENAAIFIAGSALLELLGGGQTLVMILCTVFVLGRVSHAIALSMTNPVNPFRTVGVISTIGVGLALGVRLITVGIGHLQL